MKILGIDPGPAEHGWALVDTDGWRLVRFGSSKEISCFECNGADFIGIEEPEPIGVMLSHDLLATIRSENDIWNVTRMICQSVDGGEVVHRVKRSSVKLELLGKRNANATQTELALRARWCDRHGCTERELKGTKKNPGPLYGVAKHVWPALGVIEVVAARLSTGATTGAMR